MKNKVVCFAGHRYEWNNIGIEEKLNQAIETLIQKGYYVFYDGAKGDFDKKSARAVCKLKTKYPQIKLILVLTYYHHDKEKWELPSCYDGSVFPDIEEVYPKQKIIKRNQWIIDNSDVLVCHIKDTFNSGAYKTVQYAQKQKKDIIEI